MEKSMGTIDEVFEPTMSDDLPVSKLDKSIYVVAEGRAHKKPPELPMV